MEKLDPKLYSIFDRVYMAFGSIMNSCQHIITPENKDQITEWAWNFALEKTTELLNELYKENEEIVVEEGETKEMPL